MPGFTSRQPCPFCREELYGVDGVLSYRIHNMYSVLYLDNDILLGF